MISEYWQAKKSKSQHIAKPIKSKGLKALKKTSGDGEMLGTYMADDPADVILK